MLERLHSRQSLLRVALQQAGQKLEAFLSGCSRGRVLPVFEGLGVPGAQARAGAAEFGVRVQHGYVLGVLRILHELRPVVDGSEDLKDLLHLVLLKGHGFLIVHFCFLALEDGPQGEEFGEYASDCPEIDRGRVVPGAEEEFGGAVPDCHDDFVAVPQGEFGLAEDAGEAEVADCKLAGACYHDVGGLQIAVHNPACVEVLAPL